MRSRALHAGAVAALVTALVAVTACGGEANRGDSVGDATGAQGTAADTMRAPAAPPTAGPAPSLSGVEDGEVMRLALEMKLTDRNVDQFLRASEALGVLRARDPQARAVLERQAADASPAATAGGTAAAGQGGSALESLEGNAAISKAIADAGMSVRDYLVMAVAVANAQRFADRPQDAPPTAVGRDNAEYVRRNAAKLGRLRVWGG